MKRVLVTGGSRGIGLAICRRLLAEGWQVTTCARRRTNEVVELETAHGERFVFVEADLSEASAIGVLSARAQVLEGLDGFVANAALGTEGLLTLTSEKDLRRCVEVNLISVMVLAREVIKGMLVRGTGGRLVLVSSIAGRTGFAGLSVYGATKGALVAFGRSLAREYGERGIAVNCVSPGFVETEMTSGLGDPARETLRRRTALGRVGQADDVVGAVAFLLSPEARWITGTEMVVDGGATA